ncbi:MAG: diguanylate cyclase [Polyangiaceae bacterium]|nr:diguanylate cyclase [Polyangiaceae bacterium]
MTDRDPPFDLDDSEDDDRTTIVRTTDLGRLSQPTATDRHLLVGVHGQAMGQVVQVVGTVFLVGRQQNSELCLRDSGVSRRHALLRWNGSGYDLEDQGSGNGTYVNGERTTVRTLQDGDIVQFGPNVVFRYSVTDANQEAMLHHLYETSVSDPLTGAHNREHMNMRLAEEVSYAKRHNTGLALIMFDLDHFKRVNDTYGHLAGDRVLVALVQKVSGQIRGEDLLARFGGEEFVILLRTTDLFQAANVAERIRQSVERMSIEYEGQRIRVTVSLGCATLDCCDEPSVQELIAAADRRLYAAKRAGRNRVVASD